MTEDIIYLDYNATTPHLPEVVDAMLPFLRDHFGNPSSSHVLGRAPREAVGTARAQVAALIASDPEEISRSAAWPRLAPTDVTSSPPSSSTPPSPAHAPGSSDRGGGSRAPAWTPRGVWRWTR